MMKTSYDPEADAFAAWFAPEGWCPSGLRRSRLGCSWISMWTGKPLGLRC